MDGNEDSCSNCKQIIIENEQHYKCDLCVRKLHKACTTLSASEIKCMPLQKRLLILLCNECKTTLANAPLLVQLMGEMKNELISLKNEIQSLKVEINTKRNLNEIKWPTGSSEKTFSDAVKTTQTSQSPSLIIKPKQKQSSEETKKDLKLNIEPSQLNIGIKNVRETKQGCIVIKCIAQNDIEKLKQSAENRLGKNYNIETMKLKLPRMKIVGYRGTSNMEELENIIKKQNTWIEDIDRINITYIKEVKNKKTSTIFFECSPNLYWKLMDHKKICIGWERYTVFENLSVKRCFKCQEFYHKSNDCENEVSCEYCAGHHETSACTKQIQRCKNCVTANNKFKLNYNIAHAASDPKCPSTMYHTNLLKSRIDYGT